MIGTGLRELGQRRTVALVAAVALLAIAFVADTATTAAAGSDASQAELNPLARGLSLEAYLVFAALRLLACGLLLMWFWPASLEPRSRNRLFTLFHPLAFRDPKAYFGAVILLVGSVVKLAAASSNCMLIVGSDPPAPALVVIAAGCIVGVPVANSLFLLHRRSLH